MDRHPTLCCFDKMALTEFRPIQEMEPSLWTTEYLLVLTPQPEGASILLTSPLFPELDNRAVIL